MTVLHSAKFKLGQLVCKISGAEWHGVVVGTYSSSLTAEGYVVESIRESGSCQLYPVAALRHYDQYEENE